MSRASCNSRMDRALARIGLARVVNLVLFMAGVAGIVGAFVPLIAADTDAAQAVRVLFSHSCHQIPNRCYTVNGLTMPVCARCLGVYAGFAVAAFVALTARRRTHALLNRYAAFLVCILVLDWVLAQILFPSTPNALRTATGFAGGTGIAMILNRTLVLRLPLAPLGLRLSAVMGYLAARLGDRPVSRCNGKNG